jgi:hypothetical protein
MPPREHVHLISDHMLTFGVAAFITSKTPPASFQFHATQWHSFSTIGLWEWENPDPMQVEDSCEALNTLVYDESCATSALVYCGHAAHGAQIDASRWRVSSSPLVGAMKSDSVSFLLSHRCSD